MVLVSSTTLPASIIFGLKPSARFACNNSNSSIDNCFVAHVLHCVYLISCSHLMKRTRKQFFVHHFQPLSVNVVSITTSQFVSNFALEFVFALSE